MKLISSFAICATLGLVMYSCGGDKKTTEPKAPDVPTVRAEGLKIAFYNTDTLNKRFTFLVEQEKQMTVKQEKFQNTFTARQRELEKKAMSIQEHREKMDVTGAQLEGMMQEYQRQEQSLMNYQQTEGTKIQNEAAEIQQILHNKVDRASKEYCQKYGIDILLMHGSGGQFGYINPTMEVTNEFIDYLNKNEAAIEADMGKK